MAYDKIARQRERRAEKRAAKLALEARLQPSIASSLTRGDVYTAKTKKCPSGKSICHRSNRSTGLATRHTYCNWPASDWANDPPTRWHRWNNSEHDIISRLMEMAANQEQRIRVLEAAEAERQTTAKPEFSKLGLGAASGLLGFGLFMWATHTKPQS
jgi:hypothetical protein